MPPLIIFINWLVVRNKPFPMMEKKDWDKVYKDKDKK